MCRNENSKYQMKCIIWINLHSPKDHYASENTVCRHCILLMEQTLTVITCNTHSSLQLVLSDDVHNSDVILKKKRNPSETNLVYRMHVHTISCIVISNSWSQRVNSAHDRTGLNINARILCRQKSSNSHLSLTLPQSSQSDRFQVFV